MNFDIIKNFYDEVKEQLGNDYKIVLEPNSNLEADFIEKDSVEWYLEDIIKEKVETLKKDNSLSLEEKILALYEYICLKYVYDDNVLFFFKMDKTDVDNIKYIAADFYGRIIDNNWLEKRKKHNRRICYEFSRFFAKAINIFIEQENMEAFILGLKDNTHYITVISGDEYSAILDLDDFNKIKDLTRLKLGLTLEGITILRDENNILKSAIDKFNINRKEELDEIVTLKEEYGKDKDFIKYLKAVVEVIRGYNLDSQGFQEYMRKIIEECEIKIDKIWKKETEKPERRYVRCLVFEYKNQKYLVDSIKQELSLYQEDNLDKDIFVINSENYFYNYYGG